MAGWIRRDGLNYHNNNDDYGVLCIILLLLLLLFTTVRTDARNSRKLRRLLSLRVF